MRKDYSIKLGYINHLYPIEGYIEELIPKIKNSVINNGYWMKAIKIESNNRILDGHHRFEIAKRLGLKRIPIVIFDYNQIKMWSLRDELVITKEDVYRNSIKGILYPNKTVKHEFPDVSCKCKIKLEELR